MSYIMRSALGSICAFARRKPLLFALLVISSWAMIYFMLHSINGFVCDISAYKDNRSFDSRVTIDCADVDARIAPADAVHSLNVDADVRIYLPPEGGRACVIAVNNLPAGVQESEYFLREGRALTDDEIALGANVCMVTPSAVERGQNGTYTGQSLALFDTEFEIVGAHNGFMMNDSGVSAWDNNIIVAVDAIDGAQSVSFISLDVHSALDASARTAIREWAQRLGIDAGIKWPGSIMGTARWQSLALGTLLQIAILMLSLINALVALVAWLHIDRAELNALFICGASRYKLLAMVSVEAGLIALVSALPAVWLYYVTGFVRVLGGIPYNLLPWQIALTVLMCVLALTLLAALRCKRELPGARRAGTWL